MVVLLRRKPARRVVWMAALFALACQREPGKQTKAAPASEQVKPAGIEAATLEASLKRGVQRVSDNSGSYRIDGFVAVLLQQHLSSQTPGSEGIDVGTTAPGTLLGELGLKSGDRLLAVNGTPLAGLAKAEITAAFAGDSGQVELAVVRDGVTSNFAYQVVDSLAWRGTQRPVAGPNDAVVDLSVAMPEQPDPFAAAAAGHAPSGTGRHSSGTGRQPSGTGRRPGGSGPSPAGRGSSSGRAPAASGGKQNAGTNSSGAKTSARCQGSNCTVSMQEFSRYTNNPSSLLR
ncbi:MAG: PDZ domain-containing protein, partial [Nannocystaceae bacterium]